MSKELEVLEDWLEEKINEDEISLSDLEYYKKLKSALTELKVIKEASPSEALKNIIQALNHTVEVSNKARLVLGEELVSVNWNEVSEIQVIKQAILKAQEQEKEKAYIEKIKTMMKQKDCALRYIESEDCFAVKTILSDGWYRLTPEFVENNIREEIKPLPLIEKNKQLKEENAEYKKVLKIIKEKCVGNTNLDIIPSFEEYDTYYLYLNYHCVPQDTPIVKENKMLSEEEFYLLKKYFN